MAGESDSMLAPPNPEYSEVIQEGSKLRMGPPHNYPTVEESWSLWKSLRLWVNMSFSNDLSDSVEDFEKALTKLNFDVDARLFCGCGDNQNDAYFTYAQKDPKQIGMLDHGRCHEDGKDTTGYTDHFPFTATPLHYAMWMGATQVVEWLLRCGADPCMKDHLDRDFHWFAADNARRYSERTAYKLLWQNLQSTMDTTKFIATIVVEDAAVTATSLGGESVLRLERCARMPITFLQVRKAIAAKTSGFLNSVQLLSSDGLLLDGPHSEICAEALLEVSA